MTSADGLHVFLPLSLGFNKITLIAWMLPMVPILRFMPILLWVLLSFRVPIPPWIRMVLCGPLDGADRSGRNPQLRNNA